MIFFNMYCIKYVIGSIAKLFDSICNLSYSAGIFSDIMKIGRVILIYENEK